MSTFGLNLVPLQRKVSGSKRNRAEFGFHDVGKFDFCDLPVTPTKRQKTPTSRDQSSSESDEAVIDIKLPPAARNLSLENVPDYERNDWQDIPAEIESPRLNTPEGWQMFQELVMLDMMSQGSLTQRSTASAPTPGKMDLRYPFGGDIDNIENRFQHTMRSATERRSPWSTPVDRQNRSILGQFNSRAEAEEYNRRLASELNMSARNNALNFNSKPHDAKASPTDLDHTLFRFPKSTNPQMTKATHTPNSGRAISKSQQRRRCMPAPEVKSDHIVTPTPRKRKLCRHFLKGFCKQGDKCNFLHDASIFSPDSHKVFLGGLPSNTTSERLVNELKRNGFKVMNRPQVLRGFSPKVCMETAQMVKDLVTKGHIKLWGTRVDVRPYQDKKPDSEARRSVFLGGLADNTTAADIKEALEKAGAKLRNTPVLKSGFAPQVVVDSSDQAQRLVQIKQVLCRGKMIDIRPFVDLRPRKRPNHVPTSAHNW